MKKLLVFIVVGLVLLGLYRLFTQNPSIAGAPETEADVVLYWGIGCPHCENVKNYIKTNNLDQKLKITYKETYYNKQNQKDLETSAKNCQLDTGGGIGVPLALFKASGQCLVGDQPIIDQLNAVLK